MSTVIKVENLSKRYRLGLKETRKDTLFAQIGHTLTAPIRNFKQLRSMTKFGQEDDSVFWALNDINFEVQEGEVLGIIGHNGAGKSTLLKLLSRITEPTTGSITLKGRVAALLEVGTGFHQDLTGRENIYMNGTILGMTKKEIDHKLDEIVAFSGVEKHLDTPVKFYSSGMKVRLGFSVAAHLDPEILIIDEVLAVGDAEFQKKCLGKMESVAGEGRTVIFVSHDMTNVSQLCSRALLLSAGKITFEGAVNKTINSYLGVNKQAMSRVFKKNSGADAYIKEVYIQTPAKSRIVLKDEITFVFKVHFRSSQKNVHPVLKFRNSGGINIFDTTNYFDDNMNDFDEGDIKISCKVPAHIFNNISYSVDFLLVKDARYTIIKESNAISFNVFDDGSTRGAYVGEWNGLMRPLCKWTIENN
jgi:lipopolysaccharide transport system ATP-binding protein